MIVGHNKGTELPICAKLTAFTSGVGITRGRVNPDGPEAAAMLQTAAEALYIARKALDRNYVFNINLEDVHAIIDAALERLKQ